MMSQLAAILILGIVAQFEPPQPTVKASVDGVEWKYDLIAPVGTPVYVKFTPIPPNGMGGMPVGYLWLIDGANGIFTNQATITVSMSDPGEHAYSVLPYNAAGGLVQNNALPCSITYVAANSMVGKPSSGSLGEVTQDPIFLFALAVTGQTLPPLGRSKITGTYYWDSAPLATNPPLGELITTGQNIQISGIHFSEQIIWEIGLFTPDNTVLDTLRFNFNIYSWNTATSTWQIEGTVTVPMKVVYRKNWVSSWFEIKP